MVGELIGVEGTDIYLKLGGGCQGCGMADLTLADGVDRLLKERIPEVKVVTDMTDHSFTDNAFYNPATF